MPEIMNELKKISEVDLDKIEDTMNIIEYNSNNFDLMLSLQKSFGSKWTDWNNPSLDYKEKRTSVIMFALMEEVIELKRCLNLKEWKKEKREVDIEDVKYEIIDILHFVLTLALIWGMDEHEIYDKFWKKQIVNRYRQLKSQRRVIKKKK